MIRVIILITCGLLQLNVAQLIKTLTSFWGHDGGWDPDLTSTIDHYFYGASRRAPAHSRRLAGAVERL